jgi:hypothetical protein
LARSLKKENNATIMQDQSATTNPLQDAFQKAQSDKQKPATALGVLVEINVIVEVASIAATKGEHAKYAERTIKGLLTNSKQIKEISVDAIELND